MTTVTMVDVGKLTLADDQLRQEVGDVAELAASIKSLGILEPLLVQDDGMVVVAGTRRLAAAKRAGLTQVPAIVRPFTEQERLETMVVENLQREGLSPMEEAHGLHRLLELGLSQREIAGRVGMSQATVSKRLAMLELPDAAQEAITSGKVTLEEAQSLTRVKDDPELVEKLTAEIVKSGPVGDRPYAARQVNNQIERELQKRDRTKKATAAMRAVEKSGRVAVLITDDGWGYNLHAPEGMKIVEKGTVDRGKVDMQPSKHAKLTCHAVGIHPRDFTEIAVCVDPTKHPSVADKQKAERAKVNEEATARKKVWNDSVDRRHEFLMEKLDKPVSKDVTLDLVYLAILERGFGYGYGAEDLLGVAGALLRFPVADDNDTEDVTLSERERIEAFSAQGPHHKVRATMAIALAKLEAGLREWAGWREDERAYFDVLKSMGYELGEHELAQFVKADDEDEAEAEIEAANTVYLDESGNQVSQVEFVGPDLDALEAKLEEIAATPAPAAEVGESPTGPGRGPSGKLRNFKQMSAEKLKSTLEDVVRVGGDQEAQDALTAEIDRRVKDAVG